MANNRAASWLALKISGSFRHGIHLLPKEDAQSDSCGNKKTIGILLGPDFLTFSPHEV